jgi:Rieske Fe-S protein
MEGFEKPRKRRTLLKWLFGGTVAAFFAPVGYAVAKYLSFAGSAGGSTTAKMSAADLSPSSPSKLVQINGEPIIVVREPDNSIRAFTATCTHLGCTVSYRDILPGTESKPKAGFYCKCHKGEYDLNGINSPGTRPPGPLTELTVAQTADDLTISLTPKAKA